MLKGKAEKIHRCRKERSVVNKEHEMLMTWSQLQALLGPSSVPGTPWRHERRIDGEVRYNVGRTK